MGGVRAFTAHGGDPCQNRCRCRANEGGAAGPTETGSELEAIKEHCDLDQLDFDTPANVLFESARIMAVDINGWTTLYSRKHLSLPG